MAAGDPSNFQTAPEGTYVTTPSVVWVSTFNCAGFNDVVKPFYESIVHATKPSTEELTSIVQNSFEMVGFTNTQVEMSKNLDACKIIIPQKTQPDVDLIVRIKTKPALKIADQLFKLEEFEI